MADRVVKLVVLVSHPIQYFVPVDQSLAKRPEVDLMVSRCIRVHQRQTLPTGQVGWKLN